MVTQRLLIEKGTVCPPEDVGGVGGYEEFMNVHNDPNHPDYEATRAWAKGQRYRKFDKEFIYP